ncbi:hypothetical protein BN874_800015 [Candidatus Contendobacter odensis Run_B_J11]|uniref:Uncharacterized protein n=1 Tax=Candidatus Contendobacter odensis Run_B_J11 TaxID=1400861 RepID=A0A7U7J5K0_9GAMM|nr:hypothetical protein BN874_800015 [Candidatus Contendobacter odensis Run_B_J11]
MIGYRIIVSEAVSGYLKSGRSLLVQEPLAVSRSNPPPQGLTHVIAARFAHGLTHGVPADVVAPDYCLRPRNARR